MVHDTRKGTSLVYGLTDDMIFSADENEMQYEAWGHYDRFDNEKCNDIYQCLKHWPDANPDKCQYGVDTLNCVLTKVVEGERSDDIEEHDSFE